MSIEKPKQLNRTIEAEPRIAIKKSSEAPKEVRENPFYDPEIWARALSSDDIYLPDNDEVISFVIASHEIGHLVERDKINDTGINKFNNVRAEEQRAWEKGWQYLEGHLQDYFADRNEDAKRVRDAFLKIKKLMMQVVDLSKKMYVDDNLDKDKLDKILKERRNKFFSEKGNEIQDIFEEIKKEKNNKKPDWDKFVKTVKDVIKEILEDNKK